MSKAKKTSQTVDLQRMIDTAVAFFLAGERCTPEFSFGRYPAHSLDAPVIVAYALSVEIALKLLHQHFGLPAHGHDIKSLFEALPQSSRDHLLYLEDALLEISNAFLRWRYPYEDKDEFLAIAPDDLRRAFIVLHNEIRRVMPNLQSLHEKNMGGFDPDWYWAWPELQVAQIEKRLGRP